MSYDSSNYKLIPFLINLYYSINNCSIISRTIDGFYESYQYNFIIMKKRG